MNEIMIIIKTQESNEDFTISFNPSLLVSELAAKIWGKLNCTYNQQIQLIQDKQKLNPDISLNECGIRNNQTLLAIKVENKQMEFSVQNLQQLYHFQIPSLNESFSFNIDPNVKGKIVYDLVKQRYQLKSPKYEFECTIYCNGVLLRHEQTLKQQNLHYPTTFTINVKSQYIPQLEYNFTIPQLGNIMITLLLSPLEKGQIAYDKIREYYNYLNQEWDISIYHHGILLLPEKSFYEQQIYDSDNFQFFINIISTGGQFSF